MKKSWAKFLLLWLATIITAGLLSIRYLPLTPSFPYYDTDLAPHYSRELSVLAHFDGIHYLRLTRHGYDDTGSQAFFPVYPFLVRLATLGYFDPLRVAVILNFIFLLTTLFLLSRNLKPKGLAKFMLLFLTFPASFFLIANYTESLFILLVVLFFLSCQKKSYLLAALIAGVASATRVVGVFLALALLVELVRARQKPVYILSLLILSVSGLAAYSYYLFLRWGDPLMFVHVQSLFGAGRSGSQIILLPQVLYRYGRMLLTTPPTSLTFIRSVWELATFLVASLALILSWRRLNLSAAIFCASVIIFPSLSGTLSSFPRYALVAIPLFITVSDSLTWRSLALISLLQYAMLAVVIALFVQGIFVA